MGSDDFYPEERPAHLAKVESFSLEKHPVTNRQFAAFVAATGYQSTAERELPAEDFAHLTAEQRDPGSLVFTPTREPVDLRDWRKWWRWVPGACWHAPQGPGSDVLDLCDHPVVQVTAEDAGAYAQWAGRRLPTEKELEFAARAGLPDSEYAWGDEPPCPQNLQANIWQGHFPYQNTGARGWIGTSPVGAFPANAYGIEDLIGNVWEWTSTPYTAGHSTCGCGPNSTGEGLVTKGGSYLCAPEYCHRYRPAARSVQATDSSTTHLGFRCAR